MEIKMKDQIHESNFVSRFIDKIRKGMADNIMKSLMAKDPELKDLIQKHKSYEKKYIDRVNQREKEYRAKGWIK
tara:strand:+ start:628 stop:849 length:222 start_codon:yes stop_codon:yes gene_type:complete